MDLLVNCVNGDEFLAESAGYVCSFFNRQRWVSGVSPLEPVKRIKVPRGVDFGADLAGDGVSVGQGWGADRLCSNAVQACLFVTPRVYGVHVHVATVNNIVKPDHVQT